MQEWLGVDLDGTLAKYEKWKGHTHIGDPIDKMVAKVEHVLAAGHDVRVFTARAYPITQVVKKETSLNWLREAFPSPEQHRAIESIEAIQYWTKDVFGVILPVTCIKDYGMSELWDDRAIQVLPNSGLFVGKSRRGYV